MNVSSMSSERVSNSRCNAPQLFDSKEPREKSAVSTIISAGPVWFGRRRNFLTHRSSKVLPLLAKRVIPVLSIVNCVWLKSPGVTHGTRKPWVVTFSGAGRDLSVILLMSVWPSTWVFEVELVTSRHCLQSRGRF